MEILPSELSSISLMDVVDLLNPMGKTLPQCCGMTAKVRTIAERLVDNFNLGDAYAFLNAVTTLFEYHFMPYDYCATLYMFTADVRNYIKEIQDMVEREEEDYAYAWGI